MLYNFFRFEYWIQASDYIYWAVIQYYWPFFLIFIMLIGKKLYSTVVDHKDEDWWYPIILMGYFFILWSGTAYFLSQDQVWLSQVDALRRVFLFWPPAIIFWTAMELSEEQSK